jgi:hypothetical protein
MHSFAEFGVPVMLCDLKDQISMGGAENVMGRILVGTGSEAIWQIPSAGGVAAPVTKWIAHAATLRTISRHSFPTAGISYTTVVPIARTTTVLASATWRPHPKKQPD